MTTTLTSHELRITRVFEAPRELLWKAWTEPWRMMRWWGPKVFTAPSIKIDLRVGGENLQCMRSPDGQDIWGKGVYREIVEPERIVVTDTFVDEYGNVVPASYYGFKENSVLDMLVTITFKDLDGNTELTLQHSGIDVFDETDRKNMVQGWNESLDKLDAFLANAALTSIVGEPGTRDIVVSRIFDAPRETVFRLMNDSLYIPKWWGPRRLTTTIDKMDFRNGGFWRFVQHDADGNEYAFHGEYYEIVRPERVDMTFEFEGMPGKVSFESISFEELNGKTLVSEKSVFETVEDRDEMLATGAEEGSIESMDRIAELLENPTENAMVCDELECFVET